MDKNEFQSLARELVAALDEVRLVEPPTRRYPGLTFPDAYLVGAEAARLREARGEMPVGRKIGYTNRKIWAQYNMDQPIWGHVYNRTVHYAGAETISLHVAGMVSPRIEPEIAFKLRGRVPAGCSDPAGILESVEWMARSFEIVDCHYEDWKFEGPDSVIDFAHHAALIIGEPINVSRTDREVVSALQDCRVTLICDDQEIDSGVGSNALDHPLLALAHLADVVASQAGVPPLAAGEIVTTGTLTAAMPVRAGEAWRTETEGLPFGPLALRFE